MRFLYAINFSWSNQGSLRVIKHDMVYATMCKNLDWSLKFGVAWSFNWMVQSLHFHVVLIIMNSFVFWNEFCFHRSV